MTKQELRPDQQQDAKPDKPKQPTLTEEIQESIRKLEKTRAVLHSAGDVSVGQTPHEVLAETRTYRLLHYQQMVSKT
ncbi:MAG: class III poly(R)-hydroxyalkanoic acid synthase subunit PhaC, partial [Thermoproteota archaeon]